MNLRPPNIPPLHFAVIVGTGAGAFLSFLFFDGNWVLIAGCLGGVLGAATEAGHSRMRN